MSMLGSFGLALLTGLLGLSTALGPESPPQAPVSEPESPPLG